MPHSALSHRVARPEIMQVLDSADPLVVLVGPLGSGRTTLLRAWTAALRADHGTSVAWLDTPPAPERATGEIVLEDVDHRDERFWDGVRHLLRTRPDVRLRLTCHSTASIPADLGATIVDDLRLSPTEVAAHAAATDSPAEVHRLMSWSRGHVGTVAHLCACRVEDGAQVRALLARHRPVPVLAGEEAMLAVPDFLTAGVARTLGLRVELLDELELAGLGQWIRYGGHPTFILLPQVRHATLSTLESALEPALAEQTPALRRRCAETLLAEGATFPAFVEAVSSGALDLADRAVRRGDLLRTSEHLVEATDLLRTVSTPALSRYPVLAFELASATGMGATGRRRGLEYFGIAALGARLAPHRSPSDGALFKAIESAALRITGKGDAGLSAARRAGALIAALTPSQRTELGTLETRVHTHTAMTMLNHGRFDEATNHFSGALGTAQHPASEFAAMSGLATVEMLRGDMSHAARWVTSADALPGRGQRAGGRHDGILVVVRALLALEDSDPATARAHLDRVWPHVDLLEQWHWVAYARAWTRIAQGEGADALEEFRALRRRRTEQVAPHDAVLAFLTLIEVPLLVAVGDLRTARRVLADSPPSTATRMGDALVGIADDDMTQVARAVSRIRPRTPLERVIDSASTAVLLRREGRDKEWQSAIAELRVLVDTYGLRTPAMFLPEEERTALGISSALPGVLPNSAPTPDLTPRELVVLQHLVHTSDIERIAESLHVSPNTIKSQRRSLFRKLGSSSRQEALAVSVAHGFLDSA